MCRKTGETVTMKEKNTQIARNNLPARSGRWEDGFRVLEGQREYVTYPEDSSFRVWFSDIPWRYDAHIHSAVEIVLTLEGSVECTVDQQNYSIKKGEILIIPPETFHSLNMGENSSRYLFLLEPDAVKGMLDIRRYAESFHRLFYLHDGSEAHIRIREMLLKAADIYQKSEMMWNTVCYSYILRIYATLGQQYLSAGSAVQRVVSSHSMDSKVINAAMNYINAHYQEDLTLDRVAKFTGFSRYYFSHSFKKQTGYSFRDYLCQKRLQAATEMLISTNASMNEIASRSGFGSVATFNRVFRESKGCTPTRYRAIYGTF